MIYTPVILLFVAVGAKAWFWPADPTEPEWDKLSATFLKFNTLPLNVKEAEAAGWVLQTDSCKDDAAYFRGSRYLLKNDHAVMLLFDSNGKIAGIQNGVPKLNATGGFYKKPYWNEDDSLLVVTAYFVDPKVICSGERKESEYLGDSLYIQIGASPDSLLEAPLKQEDTTKTKWIEGKCFPAMGRHYWYNISKGMSCDDFFPAFLLYNGGKLNAFGWVMLGDFKSDRYEHPPASNLRFFFHTETMPSCVLNLEMLSTEHIYLQRRPYLNLCYF